VGGLPVDVLPEIVLLTAGAARSSPTRSTIS
jgi:hypothetical protein